MPTTSAGAAATVGIATQAKAQDYTYKGLQLGGEPAVDRIAPAATMNVTFNSHKGVTLGRIQDIIADSLGRTGCPTCGLVGLDIRLSLDEVVVDYPDAKVILDGGQTF